MTLRVRRSNEEAAGCSGSRQWQWAVAVGSGSRQWQWQQTIPKFVTLQGTLEKLDNKQLITNN